MLKDKLNILQEQMAIKLKQIHIEHKHRGNRGDNSESILREFIREFLPPSNRVGHGEIIDTKGNISNESDVVILNEHHPYLNELSKPSLFFIEGVSAVGEVKSNLGSADIETTLKKCQRFKNMHIKMQKDATVVGNMSDIKRFVDKRPFFLFAFKSQLTLETIYKKVIAFNEENKIDIEQQIDGIYILDRGTITNYGDGQGQLRFKYREPSLTGEFATGYVPVLKEQDPNVLFNLLAFLSTSMPRLSLPNPIITDYLFTDD
ncbi:DUF6602 domain-containing protein [Sporosarcina sp. UB5]|uniref:DUF6602 domain-containing protein n=1 Tax=Sporosarcina sp. UB5 TaxID=3047463 RepID=UPI003D7BC351